MQGKRIWHYELEQGTADWFELRRGKVTGSKCQSLLTRAEWLSAGDKTLCYKLAAHDLDTDEVLYDNDYKSYWMDRGQRLEPFAIEAYQRETWRSVERVGFVEIEGRRAGCSPDGVVFAEKLGIEVKCLSLAEHLRFCESDGMAVKPVHLKQVQWCLAVTGFDRWDIIHFHPKAPKPVVITEVEREQDIVD
ncbi:MAG: YqaJ viral recombinase family protein, partial [Bacteroidota bacterium]